jgi:hypothetical protein
LEAKIADVYGIVCGGRKRAKGGERGRLNRHWEDDGDQVGEEAKN